MRVIFMGTPDFAVPSLEALVASRHQVAAVVTNPDRPRGRGRRLAPPPVKEAALALGLPLIQLEDLKDPQVGPRLAALEADLFAVVAFSLLPRRLLAVPRLGSVNLHPSLLPAYRGAAPLAWAVIEGQAQTGMSTFRLSRRMDAGDILLQEKVEIGPQETTGELEARLRRPGAELLVRSLDGLEDGSIVPQPQGEAGASRAPKLSKEDGRLDWSRPALALFNQVRGTNPAPGAFTLLGGQPFKIHRAVVVEGQGEPGSVLAVDSRLGLDIACGEGALRLTEVQPAGKARMDGAAFARGGRLDAGACLG
jgi:methionyl-tRNA formyltransferase